MTVMTRKTRADCTWCLYRTDQDVPLQEISREDDEPGTRATVIDAEKSNEALRRVAQIRGKAGRRS